MPGIASAATSVVIGYVAGGTSTIRVGAGGIMLPNHSPLVIAEQFGTLEALYPGPHRPRPRPRAGHRTSITARALRRDPTTRRHFPAGRARTAGTISAAAPGQRVQAVPGAGLDVPLWILGSSLFGAQLAAALGLPYAFASHFAPAQLRPGDRDLSPRSSAPRRSSSAPMRCSGLNVFAAETDARGAAAVHLGAAAVHQPAPRHAGQAAAADRRPRPSWSTRGRFRARPGAVRRRGRLARHRAPGPRTLSCAAPARRDHGDGADLRPSRPGCAPSRSWPTYGGKWRPAKAASPPRLRDPAPLWPG